MSEQMDFNDGKYTVIYDNGRLTALRNGEPWNRDITGDNLIYWMLVEAIRLKEERDASAAKLKEQEGQEPVGRYYWESVADATVMAVPSETTPHYLKDDFPLFARPAHLSPTNQMVGSWPWLRGVISGIPTRTEPIGGQMQRYVALDEVLGWIEEGHRRSAEAQQAEPVRLTDEQINGADGWLQEAPFWRVVKFARTIEAAVLRANGFKVEG